MPNIYNLTPFGAADLPSLSKEGRALLVLCVAARYRLPRPGAKADAPCELAEEQPPPLFEDRYHGDPASSSLKYEAQTCPARPGTDVYVLGQAQAPHDRPVKELLVGVRVGALEKSVLVMGDRVWKRGIPGLQPSAPKPFTSMPLVYERAFGGASTANPVGRGLSASSRAVAGQPLPNLEDPADRIASWRDRPAPCGLGPIARSWQPRLSLAGTYDQAWAETRAPLWPEDFDERFFCAASPGLNAPRHLRGGEPVAMAGLSPEGPIRFRLPEVRLVATAEFRKTRLRQNLALDAILLEPDEGTFTLYWRTAFPAHRALASHQVTTVRELAAWEDAAA